MLTRLPDWEPRLVAYLERCDPLPFEWGRHDCCSFAAGAVEAQTGVDFYAPFLGRYQTQRGAIRALKAQGHADMFGPFDKALGERRAPLLLQRGDIVSDGRNVGMLWYLAGPCALFVGAEQGEGALYGIGLLTVSMSAIQWGWRIDG